MCCSLTDNDAIVGSISNMCSFVSLCENLARNEPSLIEVGDRHTSTFPYRCGPRLGAALCGNTHVRYLHLDLGRLIDSAMDAQQEDEDSDSDDIDDDLVDLGNLWQFLETTESLMYLRLTTDYDDTWDGNTDWVLPLCARALHALTRNVHSTLQHLHISAQDVLLPIPLLDLLDLVQSPQSTLQTLGINCCLDISDSAWGPATREILQERIQTALSRNTSLRHLILYAQPEEPSKVQGTILFLEALHFIRPLRELSWCGVLGETSPSRLLTMKAILFSLAFSSLIELELSNVQFDSAEMMECLSQALWSRRLRPLSRLSLDLCLWTTEEATRSFCQLWNHRVPDNTQVQTGPRTSNESNGLMQSLYFDIVLAHNETSDLVIPNSTNEQLFLSRILHPVGACPDAVPNLPLAPTVGSTLQRLEIGPSILVADVMTTLTTYTNIRLPSLRFTAASINEESVQDIVVALPKLLYLRGLQVNFDDTWTDTPTSAPTMLELAIRSNGSLFDFNVMLVIEDDWEEDVWSESQRRRVEAYTRRNEYVNALVAQLLSMARGDYEPVQPPPSSSVSTNAQKLSHLALVPTLWSVVQQAPCTAPNSILTGLLSMTNRNVPFGEK
jgi:hypothetical protein